MNATTSRPPVPALPILSDAALSLVGTYPAGMHVDLARVCAFYGIPAARIHRRYSDAQILCEFNTAHAIKAAGEWRGMAQVFRVNIEHPDARAFPWGVDVPFAFLSAVLAKTVPNDEGD